MQLGLDGDQVAKIPSEVMGLLTDLNKEGQFYLVGGCLRDLLLGRTPKDWDIVTTTPSVIEGRYPLIGKDFPVWQAKVGSHTVEIAAARKEKKISQGYRGFECEVTSNLGEDLLRRDLTINTFAWDGETLTWAGRAKEDLENGILRHVSEAFAEDPLRVFRVARFSAQLGFHAHLDTLYLMGKLAEETLSLPADRVREELTKALRGPRPDLFFYTLYAAHCLEEWFPEVLALSGKPHSIEHHPEGDALQHTMMTLRKARDLGADDIQMLAVLGHDFGKALTDPARWPSHIQHEKLGLEPIKSFCDRLGYGHQVHQAMRVVCANHMHMHNAFILKASTIRKLAKSASRTVLGIQGFALCCQSDHCGRGGHWDDQYPEGEYLSRVQQAVRSVVVDPAWNPSRIEQEQISAIKRMNLISKRG